MTTETGESVGRAPRMSRALTLYQPWATLVALGVKTIETRSWPTDYRGPLLVHAGMRPPSAADFGTTIPAQAGWIGAYNLGKWAAEIMHAEPCDCDEDEEQTGDRCMARSEWEHALLADEGAHGFSLATSLPLGAIVASCTLADVVPMVPRVAPSHRNPRDEPHEGRQRLFVDDEQVWQTNPAGGPALDRSDQRPYGDFTPGRFAWLLEDVKATTERCPACWGSGHLCPHESVEHDCDEWWGCEVCAAIGSCDPIPAKGHQRLWEWTA